MMVTAVVMEVAKDPEMGAAVVMATAAGRVMAAAEMVAGAREAAA